MLKSIEEIRAILLDTYPKTSDASICKAIVDYYELFKIDFNEQDIDAIGNAYGFPKRNFVIQFVLEKTDHGIDGWDSKTTVEAIFSTRENAMKYLENRGYTFFEYGSWCHKDVHRRNCMGKISYNIKEEQRYMIDPT